MKEALFGELSVIGMRGCEQFVSQVDYYLKEWRRHGGDESFVVPVECPRFGTGEAKGLLHKSMYVSTRQSCQRFCNGQKKDYYVISTYYRSHSSKSLFNLN